MKHCHAADRISHPVLCMHQMRSDADENTRPAIVAKSRQGAFIWWYVKNWTHELDSFRPGAIKLNLLRTEGEDAVR